MNSYVSVLTLKRDGALNLGTGTTYDLPLRLVVEAVSREIDGYTRRQFFHTTQTLELDGPGDTIIIIPDTVKITSLKEDSNNDGTFDATWATNDYYEYPRNANPTADWGGKPYTQLAVSDKTVGTQDQFIFGTANYELIGTFGYARKVTEASVACSSSINTTVTTLPVNGAVSTSDFYIGDTVILDSEQMYVTNASSTSYTVIRSVNGSTAGTHGSGSAITIVNYPSEVTQAAYIQAARMWRRKDSGFANEVGFPETGQMVTFKGGLDADVKQMLSRVRRVDRAIA